MTRRTAIAGGAAGLLLLAAGCGARSDIPAVREALQSAMEDVPGYVAGTLHYQDQATVGTTIGGVLAVTGSTREESADVLADILETVTRTYLDQPNVRTAFVRLSAHPQSDESTTVETGDIVPTGDGGNTTTDDLAEHFGL